MTSTITAMINGTERTRATRLDVWRDSLGGVGRFEVALDNQDNSYPPGTFEPQNPVELKINGTSMMKGYVDDILPKVDDPAAVYRKLMKIVGRDYGQDLVNLFHTKKYIEDSPYDIILDALSVTGSELSVGASGSWVATPYEFKRTHLLDGFCDLAKLANADFYVDDAKVLRLFTLSVASSSGVTLKSVYGATETGFVLGVSMLGYGTLGSTGNNILALEQIGEKVGFDIKNYVHVEAGDVDDHWTEGNASDWTAGTGCTVSDETTMVLAGEVSLKITRPNNGIYEFSMPLTISKVGYTSIDMSAVGDAHFLVRHTFAWPYLFKCRPRLTDGSGNVIEYRSDGNGLSRDTTDEPLDGLWNKVVFPVGEGCEIKASSTDKFWSFITGSAFDWSDIISILFTSVVTLTTGSYYFDGLCLPIPARAIRENATSQGSYRKRMISLTRSDIKSQVQLNALAVDELAKRKDPTQKLKVTARFQPGCKYAGQTVVVKAPSSGIGTAETGVTYRILGIHHIAEPKTDLLRGHDAITEFDLVKHETASVQPTDPLRFRLIDNPMWAYMQRIEARLRALERG